MYFLEPIVVHETAEVSFDNKEGSKNIKKNTYEHMNEWKYEHIKV